MERLLPDDALDFSETFPADYLNGPVEITALVDNTMRKHLKKFRKSSKTSYGNLANLLSYMSKIVHDKYAKEQDLIVFVPIPWNNMRHHPNSYFDSRPDLAAIRSRTWKKLCKAKSAPSWHHVDSTIEGKQPSDAKKGPVQSGTYLGLANQARPDMTGMFGICVSPKLYWIQYSCPSGLDTSVEFTWDELTPILSYVHTLYCPRKDRPYYDTTISLSPSLAVTDAPTWDIQDGTTVHRSCTVKSVGYPWHRMSWVAEKPGDHHLVIKDSWHSDDTSFIERELYDILHKNGDAPGFALIYNAFDVMTKDEVLTISLGERMRIKTRIIMATSGKSLATCASVIDLLKIMYDILESHRWAVQTRNIIHRDISYGNILIQAEDARTPSPLQDEDRPKFVGEVLDSEKAHAPPSSRLIDFDNGAEEDRSNPESATFAARMQGKQPTEHLRMRTGTPRYIARSVAAGQIRMYDGAFAPMPELEGLALELYSSAYPASKDPLRVLKDEDDTSHGGTFSRKLFLHYLVNPELQEADFRHRPCHDAESVFWCIVVFLIQALPKDAQGLEDVTNKRFNELWRIFANHEIGSASATDPRHLITEYLSWTKYLHEGLAFVAPLLSELASQVRPEYAFIVPPPDPLHLHEAMQRIIFKYMCEWTVNNRNVFFAVGKSRMVTDPDDESRKPKNFPMLDGQHSTKRSASLLEQPESPKSKRRHK